MTTTRKSGRRAARSGQAIVLIALAMVGLLGFMILAIDGGKFYSQRRAAQNASDMAALAGLYAYIKAANPTTVTEHDMLVTINHTAELNEIADPDSTPGDAVNANITAWWLDKNGNVLNAGVPLQDSASVAPANMNAIKVLVKIPYETFIGGLIGQARLVAQAESTARINIAYSPPYTDDNTSMFTIGGDCNDLDQKIAHHYADTNSSDFVAGAYIGGSLAIGAVNASRFEGNVQVAVITGQGPKGVLPYPNIGTTNPLAGGGNSFASGYGYIPPSSTPKGYPKWTQQYGHTLDASDFASPDGSYYKMLAMYQQLDPKLVYKSVAGGTDAAYRVQTAWEEANTALPGAHVVIYVDGDLVVPHDPGLKGNWTNTTLIINGKFDNLITGNDFFTAGPIVGNVSILAGANLGGDRRCASHPENWVFHASGNNTQFHGIVYVPNGQIFFDGNTSGGREFSEAIISYSVYLDGNSWQFNFDQSKLVWPILTTELNK